MAQIQIFTHVGCTLCCCCLALLEAKQVEYAVIDVRFATPAQQQLLENLRQPEFPAVFFGHVYVGSYCDLQKLEEDGELERLLEEYAVPIRIGA